MTSAQEKAYKLRHLILVVGMGFTLAGLVWIFLPILYGPKVSCGIIGTVLVPYIVFRSGEMAYLVNAIVVIGIVFLLQWLFLRPGKNFKIRLLNEGRPLKTSVFAAGVMAMFLTTGMISLLLEFPNWWEDLMDTDSISVMAVSIASCSLYGVFGLGYFLSIGNRETDILN